MDQEVLVITAAIVVPLLLALPEGASCSVHHAEVGHVVDLSRVPGEALTEVLVVTTHKLSFLEATFLPVKLF